jgi:hypothetical protein
LLVGLVITLAAVLLDAGYDPADSGLRVPRLTSPTGPQILQPGIQTI